MLKPTLLLAFVLLSSVLQAEDWAVLPSRVELHGAEARQRLLVQSVIDGIYGHQAEEGLVFSSSDEKVVRIEAGLAVPVGNGQAVVTAKVGDQSSTSAVTVTGMGEPHAWSFRLHVEPVLARASCNSGACHGALAGKGGFKLSLRGYDPLTDHNTITRQARGRRIELSDPGRSLLLAKPSGAIAHKGGLRFEVGSLEYRVLSEWIANGAPPPKAEDPTLDKLEILPALATLKPGLSQQVIVLARYSDGHTEDVTRWVKYAATNDAVANVDENGRVKVVGYGEGAVTAWFSSQIVIARVTSPYPNQLSPEVFTDAPRRNFIDDLTLKQLARLKLRPSPPLNDSEFIRRASIDTIGTLPTAEEVKAFLADASPDKRDKLIEQLLNRPEFVDYWTLKWADMLLLNGQRLRTAAIKSYYDWIHERVANNTPWDDFVRQIVTSQGSSLENGATNFFALHQDPETMAENVSQAFLGLSIGCAKCHNHPLEKWTNNQYYGMANLFARVRAKGWGGDFRSGDGSRTLYVDDEGELLQPLTGKPQPPTPLDGVPLPFEAREDRRIHLANWLVARENPYFAKSITNRVWANFFGIGLVESVDDLRLSNPSSNDELHSALANHLADEKFNLKSLMRLILQSQTYQRGSQPLPENKDEKRFYSRYYPQRLMAEVLLDAMSQVTGAPTEFNEISFPGGDKEKTDAYPKGTRAIQLRDSAVASYFLKAFGRNQRQITCECERSEEPSMVQVLHIANGDTLNGKLKAKDNQLEKWLASGKPFGEILDEVYLASLARFPTPDEKQKMLEIVATASEAEKREVLEDVVWSVLSSREFLFNH